MCPSDTCKIWKKGKLYSVRLYKLLHVYSLFKHFLFDNNRLNDCVRSVLTIVCENLNLSTLPLSRRNHSTCGHKPVGVPKHALAAGATDADIRGNPPRSSYL